MIIIDGKKIAEEIITELKGSPKPKKFLAAVLVSNDSSSISFLKQKEKVAKELGVDFRLYRFPFEIKQDLLRKEVLKIANHKTCGGAIVQLPLPNHINKHYILNVIPREKDVDVLGERALGAFYTGRNPVLPPAVGTVEAILSDAKLSRFYRGLSTKSEQMHANDANSFLKDKKIAVVGRGFLVGRPISVWLMDKVAELRIFASKTKDLRSKLKDADIVISGVGEANLFGVNDLKDNAVVIDFGYSVTETSNEQGVMSKKIAGDFDSSELRTYNLELINFTPTPGGTGPILVAKLFENFYKLIE